MTTIETRLMALERSNRLYKRISLTGAAIAIIVFIMAFNRKQQVEDTIQAKNFEVINDQNKVLVKLTTLDGSGRITTYGPGGEKQLDLLPNNVGGGSFLVFVGKGRLNASITYTVGVCGTFGIYNWSGPYGIRLVNKL